MLKGIDPILSPDLLHALRSMGHGHEIAIVDANYPCDDDAHIIRLDGVLGTRILEAVLSVMPLESRDSEAACRMIVEGNPETELPIFGEFLDIVARHSDRPLSLAPITPDEFKQRAKSGFAIILSGDRRLYGNILLKKGVVAPPVD
ncbi:MULTISPECIES: RbsD/FucU domain-containing protein [unclassified Mesorhizobium]|uniref:RbsD/FucU family protein n=1 Tax=unclassified Mesorhizobium TaxID=325217 RepID=UPI0024167BF1|nr:MULTISPECIES: RbsD/FucU domain-containing protein [unclassified Mesorhizobium]WFP62658.1 RbsD/FucU domain-containing protein [Mesorhizobium sp. WSM4904]WFP75930.1 RbsD/FucU domain-containing protein [Mesorhizobium sp. WSM4906]